jgi:N-acetylmuramoyl-L-alanine amidase
MIIIIPRGIQDWHINGNGWCDIGYSFLVGGDGNVYEGRGWDEIGAHTGGFNSQGYGVCFLGSFTSQLPSAAAEATFHQLADCMRANGKVSA